jgi:hypothetical protein
MDERTLQSGVMPIAAAVLASAVISNLPKESLLNKENTPEEQAVEIYQNISNILWKLRPFHY